MKNKKGGGEGAFKREGSKLSKAKFYFWKIWLKATEGQFVTATGSEKRPNLHSLTVVTKKPDVIKELEKHFEKPETAVQCLVEISKGNDPGGDFREPNRARGINVETGIVEYYNEIDPWNGFDCL